MIELSSWDELVFRKEQNVITVHILCIHNFQTNIIFNEDVITQHLKVMFQFEFSFAEGIYVGMRNLKHDSSMYKCARGNTEILRAEIDS